MQSRLQPRVTNSADRTSHLKYRGTISRYQGPLPQLRWGGTIFFLLLNPTCGIHTGSQLNTVFYRICGPGVNTCEYRCIPGDMPSWGCKAAQGAGGVHLKQKLQRTPATSRRSRSGTPTPTRRSPTRTRSRRGVGAAARTRARAGGGSRAVRTCGVVLWWFGRQVWGAKQHTLYSVRATFQVQFLNTVLYQI